MNCKRILLTYLFVAITGVVCAQRDHYSLETSTQVDFSDLQSGFQQTPLESRLRCYWWWLNSMATKESITRDLEQMKAKGYGGASIVDAGSSSYRIARKTAPGPVFMSPEWMTLYQHAVKEADRLDIELSVNVQSGWNPGGPSITPEYAMKKVVFSEKDVSGGKKMEINLPPPPFELMYHDICVQAIKKEETPVMNEAISNWDKKSFNERMGWSGIYPLHILRESFDDEVSVVPVQTEEIIDLTDAFEDGLLTWDAPPGEWTIIRYGYTCTGAETSTTSDGWSGLSLDHLSAGAFELFNNTVIKPLIDAAQEVGNSVRFLQTDSWEMGVVNWTNDFPNQFKTRRGYDLEKYMPVLAGRVVESREITNRFLHDFRKTIGDCVAENHYRLFANLAHNHGLGIHPESGGPHSAPVDALKIMGLSDFPQGEFWARSNTHRVSDAARLAVKQSACVAHTYGKRFVAAEGPTSIGPQWERSPKDLKANIDRIFCSGVNRIVWHTFTSSPEAYGKPGNEYFAGTHLNPNVTWWNQAGAFTDYLNRCSYLLQQGLFVADVLYYYGDDVPNFVFLKDEYKALNFGYNWDKCAKEVLLQRATMKDGKLVLPDGMTYRVLVLPDERAINLEVLKKVEELVKQGLTVVGPKPLTATGLSNYPAADQEVGQIAGKIWGELDGKHILERTYGKGKVVWGKDINEILSEMNVIPDLVFSSDDKETALDFIHRASDGGDIYFVVNRYARKGINDFEYRYLSDLPDRYEQVACKFRITGKIPELWDPMTGQITRILTYREEAGYTVIPLHLEPEGSKFIIFRESAHDPHVTAIKKDGKSIFPSSGQSVLDNPDIEIQSADHGYSALIYSPGQYDLTWSNGKTTKLEGQKINRQYLNDGWDIHFDTNWGGPDNFSIDSLKSWTDFDEVGIKYYSGSAKYNTSFSLRNQELKFKKVLLDLGNVQEMASIKINGETMKVKWNVPFIFDITSYARPGINTLEVEVVNLWSNRLILDGKLNKDERLTQTNILKFNTSDAEKYLRVSGLLGPVDLRFIEVKEFQLN